MLAKVLLSILSEVQLIYNLYQKFDAIWKEFALTNDSIDSIIDMDMARQIAWTMQSILSVDRFAGADYRINLMAASSYITAQLCHSLSSTNSNHHNSNKSTKLQQQQPASATSSSKDKMFNLSIEEEAISALSMMPTSSPSCSPPAPTREQDHNHQFLQVIATHTNLTIDDIQHNLLLI